MPAELERASSWGVRSSLWTSAPSLAAFEVPIPGGMFVVRGPHKASIATAQTSVLLNGFTKNNVVRLYRNGSLLASDSWTSSTDSTAGIEHLTVVNVPSFGRSAVYEWRMQTSPAGATMASGSRSLIPTEWSTRTPLLGLVTDPAAGAYGLPASAGPHWTMLTTAAGQSVGFRQSGSVYLMYPQALGHHVYGVRRPVPAGPFSIIAEMAELGPGGDVRCGVFVATAGGKANVCGPFVIDNAHGAIGVTTASYTADWSSYDGYLATIAGSFNTLTLFRISWDALGGLSFARSTDHGSTWTSIGSRTGMPQPDSCGVCIYSNTSATAATENVSVGRIWVSTPA